MMKLSDKIVGLRKSRGMSQETLAEHLNVSRQAVSRWEMGTAMPDAAKWITSALMLIGRLEIFGLLMAFYPGLWKEH